MRCGALLVSRALGKWGVNSECGLRAALGARGEACRGGGQCRALALCSPPALRGSRALQNGVWASCSKGAPVPAAPAWLFQTARRRSALCCIPHHAPRPSRKKSPPLQAAICFFCWPRNLLKCISMDGGRQSGRTEPGRLHGEWKIVFLGETFLEFEALMMDVCARDGNGFVSIQTQSKGMTPPNRLRNVCPWDPDRELRGWMMECCGAQEQGPAFNASGKTVPGVLKKH